MWEMLIFGNYRDRIRLNMKHDKWDCIDMNYTKIDLENWQRADIFKFFIDKRRIVCSLTVDINVTALVRFAKENGLRFYPAMIWAVAKIINRHDEFKFAFNENGELVKWDYVSPYYADFHKEDENFSKLLTEYSENIFEFHQRFVADCDAKKNLRGFDENIPQNFFDVSCLPWVRYSHIDAHVFDEGKFLAPVIVWGKFEEVNGKLVMPLTMNIHHAVADGFHISRFFNELQEFIDSLK